MVSVFGFVRVVNENCLFKNVKNDEPGHECDQHWGRSDRQRSRYAKGLWHDVKKADTQEHPGRKALYVMQLFALFYAEQTPSQSGKERENRK